jgi:hypothetical protein
MESASGPPGPITKVIISMLWKRLFDAAASNPIYLPRVIRDGYPKWGLPSYDPARPGGTSPPVEISGVPQEVADSACARTDVEYPPIATTKPALALQNVLMTNLSELRQISLGFSDTAPYFIAAVGVGSVERPFTLSANEATVPNFLFQVGCCEPDGPDSRTCSARRWNADAEGQFVVKTTGGQITLTVQLNTQRSQPLSITVISIGVKADPSTVSVEFDIAEKPKWVQEVAEIAVNEGVGSGALVSGLQTFLNSPNVIGDIEKLVNEALKEFGERDALAAGA